MDGLTSRDPRVLRRSRARLWWFGAALLLLAALLWLLVFGADARFASGASFELGGREFAFVEPRALGFLFLWPLLLVVGGFSLADLPPLLRALSVLLRMAFVAALCLGLSDVVETEHSTRLCTTALLDVSESMPDASVEEGRTQLLALAAAGRADDTLTVVAFAADARRVELEQTERGWKLPAVAELRKRVTVGASDIERALAIARAFESGDCVARTVLLSDGIETRGHAEARLAQAPGRFSTIALARTPPADVAILDVILPPDVTVGETFEVRVDLRSTVASAVDVELYQGELLNGLDARQTVAAPSGRTTLAFRSVVRVAGPISYRAVVRPQAADRYPDNNQATARIDVPGPPRVLVVDGDPSQAGYLAQALGAQQFEVDLRAPVAFPGSTSELSAFAFVILSDVSQAALGQNAQRLLVAYVRAGGGLLYAGGAAGYGPGGWQGSTLAKILPVEMDDEKSRETPGVALALVIDRSATMTGLPLEMAKEACAATLDVLEGNDLLEVIAFDSKPTRYVKMQPARYRARIAGEVMRIQPGGGTELFASLDMAFQDLGAAQARKKHVILLTDGNASSEGLSDLVSSAFADGMTLTTVGLGTGVNEELLRSVAESGGGRFHLAPEPTSLPRIFTRETELVAKAVALEDWFPVRAVASAEFLKGVPLGNAPLLRGYTRAQLGPAPAEAILTSETGDPILARKREGLGFALAWTSDLKAHWAIDWLKWNGLGQFLGQLVRAHQRSFDERVLPMTTELWGDQVVARVEAYDGAQRFDSGYVSELGVSGEPDLSVPFRLTAPGSYEARLTLPHFGSFALLAQHRRDENGVLGPAVALSRASVSYPYSEEFRLLDPAPATLERWATAGRGHFNPTTAQLLDLEGDEVVSKRSRKTALLWAALALFVLDLAARRLRLPERAGA